MKAGCSPSFSTYWVHYVLSPPAGDSCVDPNTSSPLHSHLEDVCNARPTTPLADCVGDTPSVAN